MDSVLFYSIKQNIQLFEQWQFEVRSFLKNIYNEDKMYEQVHQENAKQNHCKIALHTE